MKKPNSVPPQHRHASERYFVPVLQHALDIFELLQSVRDGMTLTEIQRSTGVPKSTVFRILESLIHRAYISRSSDGHFYTIGERPRKLHFGILCGDFQNPLWLATEPHLRQAATDASVELLISSLDDAEAVTLLHEPVDLAVFFHCAPEATVKIADSFARAGIPIIATGSPQPHAFFVGIDDYRAGWEAGEAIAHHALVRAARPRCHILGLATGAGDLEAMPARLRISGVWNALRALAPHLLERNLLQLLGGEEASFSSRELNRALRGIPANEQVLVLAPTQMTACGILQTLRTTGDSHRIWVAAFDLPSSMQDELRDPASPLLGSIALPQDLLARSILTTGIRQLAGEAIPAYSYIRHQWIALAKMPASVHFGEDRLIA